MALPPYNAGDLLEKLPDKSLLHFRRVQHHERRLHLPTTFLRRRFRAWRFHWQWRSTRQLGLCVGEFPSVDDYTADIQVGLAVYLWHYVFFACKSDLLTVKLPY